MKMLVWLARAAAVPLLGMVLLVWWIAAALERDGYDMSSWAALLLFGGLGLSRALPRAALVTLASAFALQFGRGVCRFDQDGWVAYAAIPLTAVVLGATFERGRRAVLGVLLGLGLLIGLFTNLPALGRIDYYSSPGREIAPLAFWGFFDGIGVVNGKSWSWPPQFSTVEILVGTLVWSVGAILLVIGGWTVGSGYRARRLQWAAEARSEEDRSALLARTADLRLAEQRDRIAQDVHDITAHRLSVILAQADGAATQATDDGARAALSTISVSARSALTEIRVLLENLDEPAAGDATRGLEDLRTMITDARVEGVSVVLDEHGTTGNLSKAAALAAYRIVQEALANALRHGDGGPIRVTLDWRDEGLALFVVSGTRTAAPGGRDTGRGLPGMRERARSVGGWLTAGPDGNEYVVAAHLPADPDPA